MALHFYWTFMITLISTCTSTSVLFCGKQDSGAFNGAALIFIINVTHSGTLLFDASKSNFSIYLIQVYDTSKSKMLVAQPTNNNAIIQLSPIVAGTYTFIVNGSGGNSTYNITAYCIYNDSDINIVSTFDSTQPSANIQASQHEHSARMDINTDAMIILSVLLSIIIICFCVYYVYRHKRSQQKTVHIAPIKSDACYDVNALQMRQATPSMDVTNLMPPQLQKKTTSMMISNYLKSQVNKIAIDDDSYEFSESSDRVASLEEALQSGQQDAVDRVDVISWLQLDVKLPQYYNNFVENGYDSMEFIKDIRRPQELIEIGITSKEDHWIIMKCIKMLGGNVLMLDNVNSLHDGENMQNDGEKRSSVYSEGPDIQEGNNQYFSHGTTANSKVNILHETNDGKLLQSDEHEAYGDSDENEFIVCGNDETDQGLNDIQTRF